MQLHIGCGLGRLIEFPIGDAKRIFNLNSHLSSASRLDLVPIDDGHTQQIQIGAVSEGLPLAGLTAHILRARLKRLMRSVRSVTDYLINGEGRDQWQHDVT
jgi:hypothetical protein